MTRIADQSPTPPARPSAKPTGAPPPAGASGQVSLASDSLAVKAHSKPHGGLGGLVDKVKNALGSGVATLENAASSAVHTIERGVAEAKDAFQDTLTALRTDGLVQAGEALLYGVTSTEFKTRQVVDDPSDVNQDSSSELAQARDELAKRQTAETQKLGGLTPAQRSTYQSIVTALGDRPIARAALQKMLLDGRLPGAKDLQGGKTLLDQFGGLTTQKLASGVERAQLLNDLVREVENPVRIAQHSANTCGATTAQILLTRKNPSEYVRVVAGLAAPEGAVKLKGGQTVRRLGDWNADNDGGRSVSSRLFQPALMQLAQPLPLIQYDNTRDRGHLGPIGAPYQGLFGGGVAHIASQLTGQTYDNEMALRGRRTEVWNEIKQALAQGRGPVPVDMTWGKGGHFVQIDQIANGTVAYTNPWGQRETMAESEFLQHLMEAQIPRA